MKIYTSYFYQIRNFKQNMIPISTALSDPEWFKPPIGKEYYIDKRGIICGLRYEPLIVQSQASECIGKINACPNYLAYTVHANNSNYDLCQFLSDYRQLLEKIDFDKMIKAFKFCLNKFNKDTIVLIVYEAPNNPCSEREYLQEYFCSHGIKCKELQYPIL